MSFFSTLVYGAYIIGGLSILCALFFDLLVWAITTPYLTKMFAKHHLPILPPYSYIFFRSHGISVCYGSVFGGHFVLKRHYSQYPEYRDLYNGFDIYSLARTRDKIITSIYVSLILIFAFCGVVALLGYLCGVRY